MEGEVGGLLVISEKLSGHSSEHKHRRIQNACWLTFWSQVTQRLNHVLERG